MQSAGGLELKNDASYIRLHCVMDIALLCMCYVKCQRVRIPALTANAQSMALAQQHEEAPLGFAGAAFCC